MSGALGCIIKIVIVLIILLGIAFVFLQCTGGINKIDKSLPDINSAAWEITTPTHLYYAEDAKDTGPEVIMTNWYEQIGGKWEYREGSHALSKELYGEITIRRR